MKTCDKCGYDITFDSAHSCQTTFGPILNIRTAKEQTNLGAMTPGAELHDLAIQLTGLCEALCQLSNETIGSGHFKDAQNLSWAYRCLAHLAHSHADKLRDIAP